MARYARTVPADRHGGVGVVPRGGRALALATLCTLLFLTFLNNTVVSVALGDMQVSLHAALYLSAGLALAAGLLAFIILPSRPAADENFTVPPRQHDRGPSRLLQEELCLYLRPGSERLTWR